MLPVVCGVAKAQEPDSVRMVEMQKVEVTATRATAKTPVAHSNIGQKELRKINYGRDIPFLLSLTPSVVATSDAGTGIGATSIRVRGTDASRINITSNGVPMNDAESHTVFWVNTPDLASSVSDMQIQRGVGTSTNGAGAFGASINISTEALSPKPYAEVSGTYGSYNTHKESVAFGTGLLGDHWVMSARISNIGSDGYIDRASVDQKAYFAQLGYYAGGTSVKFVSFGGRQKTYHAWDGLSLEQVIADRRYNPCGEITDAEGNVIGFYKDQTDNYDQYNNHLIITQRLSSKWHLNLTGHYTSGKGYYNQYKNNEKLSKYLLSDFAPGISRSNLIRQKKMVNDFGGVIASVNYNSTRLDMSFGGAWNEYSGVHFGNVSWVKEFSPSDLAHQYYRNWTDKTDFNIFARAEWRIVENLNAYADLQYRRIRHKIHGTNDNYDSNIGAMQALDVNRTYDFFNPKAGLHYTIDDRSNFYASFAVAHKEPTRNNFTDAKYDVAPKAERLYDFELGYNYTGEVFNAGFNFYYMSYKDQLVQTGEVNEIGEPLAANVPDSYRRGVELMAGVKLARNLRWDVNATFSQNRILDYTDYVDDYDNGGQLATYVGTTDISFSPKVIANSIFSFEAKGFDASFQSSFVGKQYLTNMRIDEMSLDSYFVSNLLVGYTFHGKTIKSLRVGMELRNLFGEKYCSNGWGYSYVSGGVRYNTVGLFPQAPANVLFNVTLRF